MTDKITLDHNVFDDEGTMTGTDRSDFSREQIADVMDHAVQAILARRAGKDLDLVLDELEEALVAYGLVRDVEPMVPERR